MKTLNKLFKKAKEICELNGRKYDYTRCLIFMYLSGAISGEEAEVAESYFMKKNINILPYAFILEENNIKGL